MDWLGLWGRHRRSPRSLIEPIPIHSTWRATTEHCIHSTQHSPWICNCDHPWSNHSQRVVEVDLNAPPSLAPSMNEFQVRSIPSIPDVGVLYLHVRACVHSHVPHPRHGRVQRTAAPHSNKSILTNRSTGPAHRRRRPIASLRWWRRLPFAVMLVGWDGGSGVYGVYIYEQK